MALLPFILQGSAACAAMIERMLTALLLHHVRRYGAGLPTSVPPRNSRPVRHKFAAKRHQARKT